jgi:hypothetical protein
MSILSELKTVSVVRPKSQPSIVIRRNKLISKLHDQLQCVQAKIKGEEFIQTKYVSLKKDNGERVELAKQKRLKPWWFTSESGNLTFELKYGNKKLEIVKGKTGVEVNSLNELEKVVEVLKKAVAEGELDDRINSVADVISRRIHKRSE